MTSQGFFSMMPLIPPGGHPPALEGALSLGPRLLNESPVFRKLVEDLK